MNKHMNKHKFTDKEKEYIRENAKTSTISEMAEALGLRYASIVYFLNVNKIPHLSRTGKCESGLSPREFEVLSLMAKGYSNKEIADELFLSITTIKTHLSNIYGKLLLTGDNWGHAEMRVKAVLMYLNQGEGLLNEVWKY